MIDAEEIVIDEVAAPPAKQKPVRRPRKLVEIIPSQVEALRSYYLAVLDTEAVEAVHKMRVTTRRLQASLDLLEHEMKVRKLKRRLRAWRRKLSSVRNYDVFLELIEKEAESRGRTRREQLELVKAILHERRFHRAAKVKRYLQNIKIHSIAIGLGLGSPANEDTLDPAGPLGDANVAQPAVADAPAVGQVSPLAEALQLDEMNEKSLDEAPALDEEPPRESMAIDEQRVAGYAADRLDQRLEEFQALAAQSHPTNDPAELHQLRIAAKRVRYLLEIVTEMGYGDASRALAWLRTLQDRIGDWHDLEALEGEIIAIVSPPEFMKQHLAASSQMLQAAAHLQNKKVKLVSRLFPVRVPKTVEITSRRIARALRRASTQSARASKPTRP